MTRNMCYARLGDVNDGDERPEEVEGCNSDVLKVGNKPGVADDG